MKAARIIPMFALCAVLLGCEAQPPPSASGPQRAESSSPTPMIPHELAHDESMPRQEPSSAEHQHGDMHSMLRLDQGQPWATDAPLVEGMERIRDAVNEAAALPALDADSAAALAQSIQEQVDFLIAHCRLEPDADATLHVFIAQLLNAAAALRKDPTSAEGLPQLQETLSVYPQYFAHPGWRTKSAGEG